jgi:hypothetical protein
LLTVIFKYLISIRLHLYGQCFETGRDINPAPGNEEKTQPGGEMISPIISSATA